MKFSLRTSWRTISRSRAVSAIAVAGSSVISKRTHSLSDNILKVYAKPFERLATVSISQLLYRSIQHTDPICNYDDTSI
jgi:hypothetical protein